MNFECPEAERRFRQHHHSSRTARDALFAATQLAIATVLILREGPAALPPHLRLLCWTTQAVGAAVLALALLSRQLTGCAHLRPYVLVAARLLSDVLFPHVVWQMASSDSSRGGKSDEDESASWTGLFLLWVTWSRWGGLLVIQLWQQLPFNTEALLAPFSVLMSMLNNRRMCRLLTEGEPGPRRDFFRSAFGQVAGVLSAPASLILPSWAAGGPCRWDGSVGRDGSPRGVRNWRMCAAEAPSTGSSSYASQLAGPAGAHADHVSTCLCEGVFGLSQLALALALPLALLAWSEVRARRQFAAAEQYRQQEAQLARALRAGGVDLRVHQQPQRTPPGQQHLQQQGSAAVDAACTPPPGWFINCDRMRLLLALALIEFKLFLSLRFCELPQLTWLNGNDAAVGGISATAATVAVQPHLEL
ncbi:hypothetical protein ABPG77_010129 [Micractinium sp. CCAP 211/92]